MAIRFIKAGSKLLITDQEDAAADFVAKAHRDGEAAIEKGVSTWVEESVVFNPKAEGAARYTWHKDGNRVKVTRTLVTKQKDGTRTEKALRAVWKAFDEV